MTVKELLQNTYNQGQYLKALKEARDRIIEETAAPKSPVYDDVKVKVSKQSDLSDTLLSAYAKRDKLVQEIYEEIIKLINNKRRTMMLIYKLDDYEERTLLIERYLNYKSWKEIEMSMNCSKSRLFDLHSAALEYLRKITGDQISKSWTDLD